jgi:DNA polymerase III epsilon subunit-like protein
MTPRRIVMLDLIRSWARRHLPPDATGPLDRLLEPGFVAIDLETTGLDPRRDAIVSAAAIPFVQGRPQRGFVSLVNPGRPIPPAATAIHGIDDAAVAGAPAIDRVLAALEAAFAVRIVVGHDVAFDLAVLAHARATLGRRAEPPIALDTRRLARLALPRGADSRLEAVAARLGLDGAGRHTAEGDARMAGEILVALLPALRARWGVRTVAELLQLQQSAPRHD